MKVLFAPSAPLDVLQLSPKRCRFELYVGSDQSRRAVRLSLTNEAWADPGIEDGSPYPQVNLSIAQARELADRLNTLADMIESGHPIFLANDPVHGLIGEIAVRTATVDA